MYHKHTKTTALPWQYPYFFFSSSLFYLFVIIFSAAGRGLTTHWMQWYFYLGAGKSCFFKLILWGKCWTFDTPRKLRGEGVQRRKRDEIMKS